MKKILFVTLLLSVLSCLAQSQTPDRVIYVRSTKTNPIFDTVKTKYLKSAVTDSPMVALGNFRLEGTFRADTIYGIISGSTAIAESLNGYSLSGTSLQVVVTPTANNQKTISLPDSMYVHKITAHDRIRALGYLDLGMTQAEGGYLGFARFLNPNNNYGITLYGNVPSENILVYLPATGGTLALTTGTAPRADSLNEFNITGKSNEVTVTQTGLNQHQIELPDSVYLPTLQISTLRSLSGAYLGVDNYASFINMSNNGTYSNKRTSLITRSPLTDAHINITLPQETGYLIVDGDTVDMHNYNEFVFESKDQMGDDTVDIRNQSNDLYQPKDADLTDLADLHLAGGIFTISSNQTDAMLKVENTGSSSYPTLQLGGTTYGSWIRMYDATSPNTRFLNLRMPIATLSAQRTQRYPDSSGTFLLNFDTTSVRNQSNDLYQPKDADLTDLADGTLTGSKVSANSSAAAGVVAIGVASKVWKTDGSGNPDWRDEGGGTTHNILSATHSDATARAPLAGAMLRFGTAWDTIKAGAEGQVIKMISGTPQWSTPSSTSIADSLNDFDILGTANEITVTQTKANQHTLSLPDSVYQPTFQASTLRSLAGAYFGISGYASFLNMSNSGTYSTKRINIVTRSPLADNDINITLPQITGYFLVDTDSGTFRNTSNNIYLKNADSTDKATRTFTGATYQPLDADLTTLSSTFTSRTTTVADYLHLREGSDNGDNYISITPWATLSYNTALTFSQPQSAAQHYIPIATELTDGGVLVGNGNQQPLDVTAAGTAGQILMSNGASTPTWVNSVSGNLAVNIAPAYATTGFFSDSIFGSASISGSLYLQSTSHATRGSIYLGSLAFDQTNNYFSNNLSVGVANPNTYSTSALYADTIAGSAASGGNHVIRATSHATPGTIYFIGTLSLGTQLSVANGGTGLTSGTQGAIPYYSTTTAMSSSALLDQYKVMVGGGASNPPKTISSAGTSGQVFKSGGAAADPAFATTYDSMYKAYSWTGSITAADSAVLFITDGSNWTLDNMHCYQRGATGLTGQVYKKAGATYTNISTALAMNTSETVVSEELSSALTDNDVVKVRIGTPTGTATEVLIQCLFTRPH